MIPRLYRYVYRSAMTGQFVTKDYAETYPDRTVRERVWFWQKSKSEKPAVPGVYGP